jgi:flagellar protein FliS
MMSSKNLEQLYMFMTEQLTQANIKNNVQHLHNVVRILETLYDGWKQAVEQLKKQETTKNNLEKTGSDKSR